jgi:hypothetical protein
MTACLDNSLTNQPEIEVNETMGPNLIDFTAMYLKPTLPEKTFRGH